MSIDVETGETMTDELQNRINLMIVEANSRTVPRRPEALLEVDSKLWNVLRSVEAMHARGEYRNSAAFLVEAVPDDVAYDDPWVTNALGLSLSQNGDEEESWPFFLRSEQLGLAIALSADTQDRRKLGFERAASAANNMAVSMKKARRYSESLAAAERAIEHASWFWPGYTALVAALEGRSASGDRERALNTLRQMLVACPAADNDPEVLKALTRDADYAALRRDKRFLDVIPFSLNPKE
jgi:tetratricopeptide (TPR) repeat protein